MKQILLNTQLEKRRKEDENADAVEFIKFVVASQLGVNNRLTSVKNT